MRRPFLLLVLLLLAGAARGGESRARVLLVSALAERDSAGLEAALAADEDGTAFRRFLRPDGLLALSRFLPESEAACEILERFAMPAEPLDVGEGPWTARSIEELAEKVGTPPALGLSVALLGADRELARACGDRLVRIGDPRGLPALREAGHPGFEKLADRFPRARGRAPAELWLDLAADLFAGRFPRGERDLLWIWRDGPLLLPTDPWLFDADWARFAVDRALRAQPDLAEAAALKNRVDAARAILSERAVEAGVGTIVSLAAPDEDPVVLGLSLEKAREEGEPEIRAWLLERVVPGRDAPFGQVVLALSDPDPLVREAALAAMTRLEAGEAFFGRSPSDEQVRALLAGTRASDPAVAKSARRALRSLDLTAAQQRELLRAFPTPAAGPAPGEPEPVKVKVFYGTDRVSFVPDLAFYLGKFLLGGILILLAIVLPPVLRFLLHPRFRWLARLSRWAAGGAALVAIVFAGYDSVLTRMRFDRLGVEYGGEWGPFDDPEGPYAHLGTLLVGIPPDHEVGELERPNLLSGEPWEDPEEHVMVLSIEPKERDAFFGELAEDGRERAFVFVHGFNVTFENAALRTAQIAHDLRFDGAPIFFSWPSRGQVFAYTVDENTVAWATRHLKAFLMDVRTTLPDATIHLVAHSMGNRALTEALRRLSRDIEHAGLPRFQEVVLAAPDIDAATFRDDIAPAIRGTAERITLYAASYDKALEASKQVHGYPRAGDAEGGVITVPGIQSVEVAVPDKEILGHSYYGSVGRVLDDLVKLLLYREHPERRGLAKIVEGIRVFWRIE